MRILYAIQGTGNGHLSRARDIIPALQKKGELDILVSGIQADVKLDYPVKYTFQGLSFIFGKKGGVDIWETYVRAKLKNLLKEVSMLPIEEYDLVINDFEPVSAWACYRKKKPCISLSHQSAVLASEAPQPKKYDWFGRFILRNYAPVSYHFGFHFQAYNARIFTPVIRKEIRELEPINRGHYTVYLPAYSDEKLLDYLSQFDQVQWQVFSKHNDQEIKYKNVQIQPIDNKKFIESMAGSEGVFCGAGFETPAEAMYLQKKLLVVPMKSQYEQQCNAAALKTMGVPVIKKLKSKHVAKIADWIKNGKPIRVNYPDITEQIIEKVIAHYNSGKIEQQAWEKEHSLLPVENVMK